MDISHNKLEKIRVLNELVWDRRANYKNVQRWVEGISKHIHQSDESTSNLLYALEHFIFFNEKLINSLVVAMYRDIYQYNEIEQIRKSNNDTLDENLIENELNDRLSKTKFIGIGDASESGGHILYYFRKKNQLSKRQCCNASEIIKKDTGNNTPELNDTSIEHYVFIDDFCGSGKQSSDYLENITNKIKEANKKVKISCIWLVGTEHGMETLRKKLPDLNKIQAVFELDETFKAFSGQSRYYKNASPSYFTGVSKEALKNLCTEFGVSLGLSSTVWYGYKECELLLAFHHNTPDNTLPIFWYSKPEKGLAPLFERDDKKY